MSLTRQRKSWHVTRVRWLAFAKPSIPLTVANIAILVLCLTACTSTRKATQEKIREELTRSDSSTSEVLRIRTETVPGSEIRLEIPTDSLLKLPEGSSFHAKSGQARLDIGKGKEPGTIVVYASCDSLQRQCEYYEKSSSVWRECYEGMADLYEAELKQRSNPIKTFFTGLGIGIAITVLGMIIIKNKLKNGN